MLERGPPSLESSCWLLLFISFPTEKRVLMFEISFFLTTIQVFLLLRSNFRRETLQISKWVSSRRSVSSIGRRNPTPSLEISPLFPCLQCSSQQFGSSWTDSFSRYSDPIPSVSSFSLMGLCWIVACELFDEMGLCFFVGFGSNLDERC